MNQRELANQEYFDQMYRDTEQQTGESGASWPRFVLFGMGGLAAS